MKQITASSVEELETLIREHGEQGPFPGTNFPLPIRYDLFRPRRLHPERNAEVEPVRQKRLERFPKGARKSTRKHASSVAALRLAFFLH